MQLVNLTSVRFVEQLLRFVAIIELTFIVTVIQSFNNKYFCFKIGKKKKVKVCFV